jgi:hypothetical protein
MRYIKSETISYYIFRKNLVQGTKLGLHSDLMQSNLVELLSVLHPQTKDSRHQRCRRICHSFIHIFTTREVQDLKT